MDVLTTARALSKMIPTSPVHVTPRVLITPRWFRSPVFDDAEGSTLVATYEQKAHPFQTGTRFTLSHDGVVIATGTDMHWDPDGILGAEFYHFEIRWENLPRFTTSRSQRRLRHALLARLTHRRRY